MQAYARDAQRCDALLASARRRQGARTFLFVYVGKSQSCMVAAGSGGGAERAPARGREQAADDGDPAQAVGGGADAAAPHLHPAGDIAV